MKLTSAVCAAAIGSLLAFSNVASAQTPEFFRIGTGSAGGTYFPIGGTIANGISAPPGSRPCDQGGQCGVPGLIAIAQSTTASVFNNAAVQNGELEAGLAAGEKVVVSDLSPVLPGMLLAPTVDEALAAAVRAEAAATGRLK